MIKNLLVLLCFTCFVCSLCSAQQIPIVSWSELEKSVTKPNVDSTYVINFWATWCKPCIDELPAFIKLQDSSKQNVKVILASLDFKKDLSTKLKPFVLKRTITTSVVLLYDQNQEEFINSVSTMWSGALPATIIINTKRNIRSFYERQFTYNELTEVLHSLLHQ